MTTLLGSAQVVDIRFGANRTGSSADGTAPEAPLSRVETPRDLPSFRRVGCQVLANDHDVSIPREGQSSYGKKVPEREVVLRYSREGS